MILLVAASLAASSMSDVEIEQFLKTLLEPGKRHLNVEPAEGAYLRDVARKAKAKRILEVGTSTGYSGIWMAMALRGNGGKLITLEIDPGRRRVAEENFRTAGLADLVEVRLGDALREIPKVEGPFDMVFLDAEKSDYLKYYDLVIGKMRKGGVITAHNVVSHPGPMADFLARIKSDPRVKTEIVTPGWQGISVSWVQ